MLTGNGQAAGDWAPPLPLSAMRDVACLDAFMYAPARVAVLVDQVIR